MRKAGVSNGMLGKWIGMVVCHIRKARFIRRADDIRLRPIVRHIRKACFIRRADDPRLRPVVRHIRKARFIRRAASLGLGPLIQEIGEARFVIVLWCGSRARDGEWFNRGHVRGCARHCGWNRAGRRR